MLRQARAAARRAGVWVGEASRSKRGRLTRKAHPWVDSRPSEDQAAFAERGRSEEGLALWLPSLSDPFSVAHPPPTITDTFRTSAPPVGRRSDGALRRRRVIPARRKRSSADRVPSPVH